jgi:hypothetical protein
MAHLSDPPARSGLPKWFKVTLITLLVVANLGVLAVIWAVQTGNTLLTGADTDDEVVQVLDRANNGTSCSSSSDQTQERVSTTSPTSVVPEAPAVTS